MSFHINKTNMSSAKNILFAFLVNTDDFIINAVANLFIHERLKIPESYSEPSQASKMELFTRIINGLKPSKTFSTKNSKLSDWVLNTVLPPSQKLFKYF